MPCIAPVKVHNLRRANASSTSISIQSNLVHNDSRPLHYRSFLDEDSHADMHCAGSNFTVLKYSGYKCDVDPFLDTYATTTGVDVVTAATAIQLSAGDVMYLVSTAALWFGDKMAHSLFNGNIARDAGLELCTDPYDPHRELGIRDRARGLTIPLQRRGNFVGLSTYKPDRDDVLQAIANGDRNVLYLDPHDEYEPPHEDMSSPAQPNQEISGVDTTVEPIHENTDDDYRILRDVSTALDLEAFARGIITSVNISDVGSTMITQRHSAVTPERISDIFGCGLETAKATLRVTTQHGVRSAVHPLRRRYRTDLLSLKYRRLGTTMYTDTMHFKVKSLDQHKCAQVYATDDFAVAYPVRAERLIGDTLRLLAEDVGVPREMVSDNASAMIGHATDFAKRARFLRIKMRSIEPHHSRQNKGERVIGELRRRWRDKRRKKNMPRRLWDYALVWCAEVFSRTYNHKTGRTGLERLLGDTPDISEYLDFDLYDRVWFWDAPHKEENPKPGRWLGVSHRIGSALCYWVIDAKGQVLACTTVQHVTDQELKSDDIRTQFEHLDSGLTERLRDDNFVASDTAEMLYEEDVEDEFNAIDEGIDNPEPIDKDGLAGDIEEDTNVYDEYLGAELLFDVGPDGSPRKGTVVKRLKGEDGRPIGRGHHNPYLDTRKYEVEIDGIPHEYAANTIAENLFSQVDSEGRRQLIFKAIIDHRKDNNAINVADGTILTRGGQQRPIITTKGWQLKVEWADGTASWLPLSEVKNASPVETAEYAVASKIDHEPAFKWWVAKTLRKRKQIVAKVKSRYWRTTHKFGVRLPHSVEEAYKLDAQNGNDFWRRAIEKEMSRVRIAFEKWLDGTTRDDARKKLVGYQEIRCHMIFDIKMTGLVRKARFVAGGHTTDAPSSITGQCAHCLPSCGSQRP